MPVDTHDNSPAQQASHTTSQQIVPAAAQGLALRSAALVVRGLRDLARDSNWLVKKVFPGHTLAPRHFVDGRRRRDFAQRSRGSATRGAV